MASRRGLESNLIDLVAGTVGVVLVVIATQLGAVVLGKVLEEVGSGLVGAGLVSYLVRRFLVLREREHVRVVAGERYTYEPEYKRRTRKARKRIDISSVALSGALEGFETPRLLDKVLSQGVHVRLVFQNPLSDYVKQRSLESEVSADEIINLITRSVVRCTRIHHRLKQRYETAQADGSYDRARAGRLQIRMTGLAPYCTIFRTEEVLLWGLYTSGRRGIHSAAIEVPKEQDALFGELVSHFSKVWQLSEEGWLVRFDSITEPVLNAGLVEKVLGPGWERMLAEV